jgi:hypothetical protein
MFSWALSQTFEIANPVVGSRRADSMFGYVLVVFHETANYDNPWFHYNFLPAELKPPGCHE